MILEVASSQEHERSLEELALSKEGESIIVEGIPNVDEQRSNLTMGII